MPTYLKVILAILLVGGLVAIFIITFLINKKTKEPDNCPKAEVGCAGCMLSCSKREEDTSISAITSNLVSNYKDKPEEETKDKSEEKTESKEDSKERK